VVVVVVVVVIEIIVSDYDNDHDHDNDGTRCLEGPEGEPQADDRQQGEQAAD